MSDQPWTVGRLLHWTAEWLATRGSEFPRLDAEVLLSHVLSCSRIELYTTFDKVVADEPRTAFRELLRRRADGAPVAYLTGQREFFSLPFKVTPAVLVPRPETEQLVVRAIDLYKKSGKVRIVDVGTGSGNIAITLAKHLPAAVITAIDISNDALAVAKQNAEFHGVADRIDFIHGNLFDACDLKMQWDLIVSNPPYIREEEFDGLPRDVRMHEPKEALIAGPRGVEVIERLARESVTRLLCGGWLLIEIGPPEESEQAVDACLHLKRHPTLLDLADIPRVIHAQMQ